jgi:5'(3')-deoxyribonucleotidase
MTLPKKKILLLDLDGILTEFNRYTVEKYNEVYKENHNPDYADYLISDSGPTNDKLDHDKIVALFDIPNYFRDMPPKEGAIRAVYLLEKFFDIHIVSKVFPNSCLDTFKEKVEWVKQYLPFLKDKIHLITGSKALIKGDILVDDAAKNQREWKATWPNGIVASLKYPWTDNTIVDIMSPNWSDLSKILILNAGETEC